MNFIFQHKIAKKSHMLRTLTYIAKTFVIINNLYNSITNHRLLNPFSILVYFETKNKLEVLQLLSPFHLSFLL